MRYWEDEGRRRLLYHSDADSDADGGAGDDGWLPEAPTESAPAGGVKEVLLACKGLPKTMEVATLR